VKAFLRQLHNRRDAAVAVVCALGLAFAVLVLPQMADTQAAQVVATK
jgi:hypothetical protein